MKYLTAVVLLIAALIVAGCSSSQQTASVVSPRSEPAPEKAPALPSLTVQVASLNLANVGKRIEKSDIEMFANLIRKEKIDILAIQGIARYPGVETRIDFVDEFAARSELRKAFGESVTLSGRQSGNAVFSNYPILSSENVHYDGIKSMEFESALHAVVDGGTRNLVVVSTMLPPKATVEEQSRCVKSLIEIGRLHEGDPMIIAGNLPGSGTLRSLGSFDEAGNGEVGTRIWHSPEGLRVLQTRKVSTNLGPLVVAQFGIFRKPGP